VRVVHSLFASSDDCDDQLEGWENGWPWFFRILPLYLTHFPGQPCSAFRVMGVAPEPEAAVWEALTGSLGHKGVVMSQRWNTPAGVPPLAGDVEQSVEGEHHALLLRMDQPMPGIASFLSLPMGGQVYPVIDFFLYGDQSPAAVARDEPLWHAWMYDRFPAVADASNPA
jgi:hypothetical protein